MISLRTEGGGEETLSLDEFEARIRQGRIAPTTPVRFPVLTGERWVDARDLELFRRLYEPARIYFARAFTLGGFPLLTTVLVLAQIALFFGLTDRARALPIDPLIEAGAKVAPNIIELGQTWRLLTANVLHRDLMHLLFNMFFLFNVGGTIENAYRRQDYAFILVVSALSTTLVSTLMAPLPSVGASGMVLGLFGAASVFGHKYSEILPRRYRKYFVWAVLPYTLLILYVGLATRDTDNWGHLGGLLGGCIAAIPLEPRLLHFGKKKRPWLVRNAPGVAAAAMVLAALGSGPIVRSTAPSMIELVDHDSGLRVVYPSGWFFGENHLGYASWGNTLGTSIGLRARRENRRPASLDTVRQRFIEHELARPEKDGDITGVELIAERPFRIEGGQATELRVALESRAGPQRTRNILIARGYYSYAVVLSAPAAWSDAYEPVFDAILGELRLLEPARLQHSRDEARTFPGMSSAHVELGNDLASIGDVEGAARAYEAALQTLPEQPEALFGLAKLAVDYAGDLKTAETIASQLYARRPDDPAVAALLSDVRERLGELDSARAVLQETLDRVPNATELRERLLKLR